MPGGAPTLTQPPGQCYLGRGKPLQDQAAQLAREPAPVKAPVLVSPSCPSVNLNPASLISPQEEAARRLSTATLQSALPEAKVTVPRQLPSAARRKEGQSSSRAKRGQAPEEVRQWPRKRVKEFWRIPNCKQHGISGHIWSCRGQEGKNLASLHLQNILPQALCCREGQRTHSPEDQARRWGKREGPQWRGVRLVVTVPGCMGAGGQGEERQMLPPRGQDSNLSSKMKANHLTARSLVWSIIRERQGLPRELK